MNDAPQFQAYGLPHLTVIFLTIVLPFALAALVCRAKSHRIEKTIIRVLSAFLMLTRRYRPYPMSIVRVWLWSEFYFVDTLAVDKLTGFNYGFLLHKPEAFSILSFLSDSWPLYLLQMHAVALLFFLVLYAPFAVFDATKRGLIGKPGKQEAAL